MALSLVEFADRMSEIIPVIIKEFASRNVHELYKENITLPQILVLQFLDNKEEAKMTDIAHFMKVSTAAMTGIVDRLVRYGYAVRTYEPQDRRIVKIKLTHKGNESIKKINRQRRQMVINIFGKLSEVDRQNYLRIIMQIKEVVTEEKTHN